MSALKFCHQVIVMKHILLWIFTLHAFTVTATSKETASVITAKVTTKITTEIATENSLADLKWQHRLLITQIDTENELYNLRDKIQSHSNAFGASKLLMLIRIKNETWIVDASTARTASPQLNNEVLKIMNQNLNQVLLIGLDGGIKYRYPTDTFNLERVFNKIDSMPMRQAEINN
jgi:hypothetical protein